MIEYLSKHLPTWVVPVAMLLVIAHWAVYYLGVLGILAWHALKWAWRMLA